MKWKDAYGAKTDAEKRHIRAQYDLRLARRAEALREAERQKFKGPAMGVYQKADPKVAEFVRDHAFEEFADEHALWRAFEKQTKMGLTLRDMRASIFAVVGNAGWFA